MSSGKLGGREIRVDGNLSEALTQGWDFAPLGKRLLCIKIRVPFLEPILKTANQTLDVLVRACKVSTGKEAETGGWIPGVHWPATLASLVRGTDSKKKKKCGQDPRNDRTT